MTHPNKELLNGQPEGTGIPQLEDEIVQLREVTRELEAEKLHLEAQVEEAQRSNTVRHPTSSIR
jgi:TolA-binding protein